MYYGNKNIKKPVQKTGITCACNDHGYGYDPNMASDYSQWTLKVAPGEEVTLYASPAAAVTYAATGFDADATTADVAWTSTNEEIAVVEEDTIGFETAPDSLSGLAGLYCAKATVQVPTTATVGSCSVKVENTKTNAYVNFTIVVNSTEKQDVSGISVWVMDFSKTYSVGNVEHSTMNFATPMDALQAVKANADNKFDYEGSATYVSKMIYNGEEIEEYTDYDSETDTYTYYGWNYRVYRMNDTGTESVLVDDSAVIGASAFTLKSNDTVVWMWGSEEMVNASFTTNLSDMQIN